MRTLLVAVGNSLRRDDGAAHRVLALLGPQKAVEVLSVLQLTPELAAEMAGYDRVVFLDAAVDTESVTLTEVPQPGAPAALTHVSRPSEIVALSTVLFGFKGRAFECRIPAADLEHGEGLSACAEGFVQDARLLLESAL